MKIILLFVCFAISGIVVEAIGARKKRISGGQNITIELAPYYVSLRRDWRHVCGGAFISRRHVLTAAHCVLEESLTRLYTTRVVSGRDKWNRNDVGQPIIEITPHEDYPERNSWCDIAVVTLSAHVEWNIKQSRIALPIADIPHHEFVMLTGLQVSTNKVSKPGLRELALQTSQFVQNGKVSDYVSYGKVKYPEKLSKIDCGGPLVYRRRIVGIVSSVIENNRRVCYIVNVFKFKTFIENSIVDKNFPNL